MINYTMCRIITVMENRQPPCLMPAFDSNPPLVTGPSRWGFLFPPQNVVLVLLKQKCKLRDPQSALSPLSQPIN